MKDAPEVSWHVKFDSQNLKHSGDLARWSTIIAHRPSSPKKFIEPKHNLATLGINCAWAYIIAESARISSTAVL